MRKKIICNHKTKMPLCYQDGVGMIEVLVALLILAIGLLGVLSLQAKGFNSNNRAEAVGQAQLLAQDMADRILAYGSVETNGNRGPINGEYGNTDTDTATPDPDCENPTSGGGCSPLNTVAYDRYEWRELLNDANLPSGRGTVTWAANATGGVYTITIYWDRDRTGAAGLDCDSSDKSATGNLTCFIMEVSL